jgi:hypothetical protein
MATTILAAAASSWPPRLAEHGWTLWLIPTRAWRLTGRFRAIVGRFDSLIGLW